MPSRGQAGCSFQAKHLIFEHPSKYNKYCILSLRFKRVLVPLFMLSSADSFSVHHHRQQDASWTRGNAREVCIYVLLLPISLPGFHKKTNLLELDSSEPEGQVEGVNIPRADSIHEYRHQEMKATNLDVHSNCGNCGGRLKHQLKSYTHYRLDRRWNIQGNSIL